MLAVVRRGPFAQPTDIEQLEYLFTRVSKKDSRRDFEKHSLEHVLSFQRRVLATKKYFMRRGYSTPLGIVEDYWDRTEVGMDRNSNCSCADGFVGFVISGGMLLTLCELVFCYNSIVVYAHVHVINCCEVVVGGDLICVPCLFCIV